MKFYSAFNFILILFWFSHICGLEMVLEHMASIANNPPPLALKDPETLQEWQQQRGYYLDKIKEAYNFPTDSMRTTWPLNSRFTKSDLDYSDYVIKHLFFQSMPKWWVTANLYLPKNATFPAPTMLYLNGHSGEGKFTPGYQGVKINMVKRGYVVLAIDECGVGERAFTGQRDERWQYFVGNNPGGLQVWDGTRSVDYLHSIPQWVDTNRIGVYGRSGGGFQSFHVAVVDDRVDLSVPEMYVSTFSDTYIQARSNGSPAQTHTLDNYIVNIRRYAEQWHLLGLIAPRPVRINAGTRDFFPIAGVRKTEAWAKNIYTLYGKPDYLDVVEIDIDHSGNTGHRSAAYEWFNTHFNVSSDNVDTDYPTETEVNLNSGLPTESTANLTEMAYIESLNLPTIPTFTQVHDLLSWQNKLRMDINGDVMGYTAYIPVKSNLNPRVSNRRDMGTYWEEDVVFNSENDVFINATFRYNKNLSAAPGLISVSEPDYDVSHWVNAGYAVLSVDVREQSNGGNENNFWIDGVLMGKPVFGQKVWDVLRGVDYLLTRNTIVEGTKMGIVGTESTYDAMYALYAAALDSRVKMGIFSNALTSYKTDGPERSKWNNWNYPLYLPRILKFADLPQIVSMIAPGCVMFSDGVSTGNQSMSVGQMNSVLNFSETAFNLLGVGNQLNISSNPSNNDYLSFSNSCMNLDLDRTQIDQNLKYSGNKIYFKVNTSNEGLEINYNIPDDKFFNSNNGFFKIIDIRGRVVLKIDLAKPKGIINLKEKIDFSREINHSIIFIQMTLGTESLLHKVIF